MIRVLSLQGEGSASHTETLAAQLLARGVEVSQVLREPRCARTSRWRAYLAARRLSGMHREIAPHLIHAHGFEVADLAMEAAEQWRKPYVLTADRFLLPGQSVRISRRWIRGVIASDKELAADLVKGLGIPERWLTVIPPGVELAEPWTPRSGSPVAVVGTAVESSFGSGLATFLEAAQRVVQTGLVVEFVVADRDENSAFARRLADGLGVVSQVTITESSDLDRTFWPVLDLYCHPLRWSSPARPLAEAMARGLPTIASDLPVLRSMSDQGHACMLVPPGDPIRLAQAMSELLQDSAQALQLGRSGRRLVARAHSIDQEVDTLAALYHRAVSGKGEPPPRHRADRAESAAAILRS